MRRLDVVRSGERGDRTSDASDAHTPSPQSGSRSTALERSSEAASVRRGRAVSSRSRANTTLSRTAETLRRVPPRAPLLRAWHRHGEIEAVEQGAGELLPVGGEALCGAAALDRGVAARPARTHVHRLDNLRAGLAHASNSVSSHNKRRGCNRHVVEMLEHLSSTESLDAGFERKRASPGSRRPGRPALAHSAILTLVGPRRRDAALRRSSAGGWPGRTRSRRTNARRRAEAPRAAQRQLARPHRAAQIGPPQVDAVQGGGVDPTWRWTSKPGC